MDEKQRAMTFEQALTVEVGDTLIAQFNNGILNEGDELILVERARDFNGLSNDTEGYFYHKKTKQCHCLNIQSTRFKIV